MATQRTIGGIPLHKATYHPIMPGGGIIKTLDHLEPLLKNGDIEFIEVGSITVEPRSGNPCSTWDVQRVNSKGMDNLGQKKYEKVLKKMVMRAKAHGKRIIANVAAIKLPFEFMLLTKTAIECGAAAVLWNLGCPNVCDDGKPHPPMSFEPEAINQLLMDAERYFDGKAPIPIWIKLSPIIKDHAIMRTLKPGDPPLEFELDTKLLKKVCDVLKKYPHIVKAVVSTNTVGQVQPLDEHGNQTIGPNPNNPNGTGGLSGPAIHAISVEQAEALRKLLPEEFDLIGCGGARDGRTIHDFMNAGCKLVQVTTAYIETQDPGIYSTLAVAYYDYMGILTGQI